MASTTSRRRTPVLKATDRHRSKPAREPSAASVHDAAEPERPEAEPVAPAPVPDASTETAEPPRPTTKLNQLVGLLRRPEGATIAQLSEISGWQSHSVRGAMAGALKKRGLTVASEKIDGVRVYRLAPVLEAQP